MAIADLVTEIVTAVPDGGDWCTADKALSLAAIILSIRPAVVVELGVWKGGSAIPMAIALRHLGAGNLLAIDAWQAEASVAGQEGEHSKWWGETMGAEGHEVAYQTFLERLKKHNIPPDRCEALRQPTETAQVPETIDVLHHDANHGPQAVLDIERWAPAIRVGGFLILDDLDWPGASDPTATRHVTRARDLATELGFVELYLLGTGCVMQRLRNVTAAQKRYVVRAAPATIGVARRGIVRR